MGLATGRAMAPVAVRAAALAAQESAEAREAPGPARGVVPVRAAALAQELDQVGLAAARELALGREAAPRVVADILPVVQKLSPRRATVLVALSRDSTLEGLAVEQSSKGQSLQFTETQRREAADREHGTSSAAAAVERLSILTPEAFGFRRTTRQRHPE